MAVSPFLFSTTLKYLCIKSRNRYKKNIQQWIMGAATKAANNMVASAMLNLE